MMNVSKNREEPHSTLPPAMTSDAGIWGTSPVIMSPIMSTGIVTMNPAIGPENPMSNNAFLLGMGSLMEISAPKVPKTENGIGMKNGKEAATLCFFAAR